MWISGSLWLDGWSQASLGLFLCSSLDVIGCSLAWPAAEAMMPSLALFGGQHLEVLGSCHPWRSSSSRRYCFEHQVVHHTWRCCGSSGRSHGHHRPVVSPSCRSCLSRAPWQTGQPTTLSCSCHWLCWLCSWERQHSFNFCFIVYRPLRCSSPGNCSCLPIFRVDLWRPGSWGRQARWLWRWRAWTAEMPIWSSSKGFTCSERRNCSFEMLLGEPPYGLGRHANASLSIVFSNGLLLDCEPCLLGLPSSVAEMSEFASGSKPSSYNVQPTNE